MLSLKRADFHSMLMTLASPFMTFRLNSKVMAVDPLRPSVTLESGETIIADLVIGADGVKSFVREFIVGRPDKPVPSGDAAYRAIIPTWKMLEDPDLKELVDFPEMTMWIGPHKHMVAYCLVVIIPHCSCDRF
jgi:salicylate hydroxylase